MNIGFHTENFMKLLKPYGNYLIPTRDYVHDVHLSIHGRVYVYILRKTELPVKIVQNCILYLQELPLCILRSILGEYNYSHAYYILFP